MGYVEPPEYDEDGVRKERVSKHTIKRELQLGLLVGEEIESLTIEDGDLVVSITESD
mgnify:CR=1 FL=1